jgi:hypothetical protein
MYMKNLTLTILLVLTGILVQAQTTTETRELNAFDQLVVRNAIEVELKKGDKREIIITASGLEPDHVSAEINKRKLILEMTGNNLKSSSVSVVVTYVQLNEIEAGSGARILSADIIENQTLSLKATTSAYMEAEVKADQLILEAETNAKMFIKGTADNLDYNAFTNAEIEAEGLLVKNAEIRTNTNAYGTFEVTESLSGTAATRGRVIYTGDPKKIDVKESLGGTIEQKE